MSVANPTDRRVTLQFGTPLCSPGLLAYRGRRTDGPPAWDSRSSRLLCLGTQQETQLGPGETPAQPQFVKDVSLREIIGWRLVPARYHFRAIFMLNGDTVDLDAGSLVLGAW